MNFRIHTHKSTASKKYNMELIDNIVRILSHIEYAATLGLLEPPAYDFVTLSYKKIDFRETLIEIKPDIISIFTSILNGNIEISNQLIDKFQIYFNDEFEDTGPENLDHLVELFEGAIKMIIFIEGNKC